MKKNIIAISVLLGTWAYGQINTQSNLNPVINQENPFLDASGYNRSNNNIGKGLYFPKVDLTTWEFKISSINPGKFSTYFDGMIVYNSGTGKTLADTSKGGKQVEVTPGFYYFKNPNQTYPNGSITNGEWVKLNDNKGASEFPWIYNNTNGNVELNYPSSDIEEYYTKTQHIQKTKGLGSYKVYPWEDIASTLPITYPVVGGNFVSGKFYDASKITQSDTNDKRGVFFRKMGIVNTSLSAKYSQVYGSAQTLLNDASNSDNFDRLYGEFLDISHQGSGTVGRVIGGAAVSTVYPLSTVVNQYGYFGQASQYSNQNSSNVVGFQGYASQRGAGTIASLEGVRGMVDNKTTLATGNITNFIGLSSSRELDANFTGSVTNAFGLYIREKIDPSVGNRIENNHGIHVNSITQGVNRYAIFTNLGNIRFGELADNNVTEDRLVTVDANGVLKTGSLASLSNLWTNDKANTSIKLTNLSDGATVRTDSENIFVRDSGNVGVGTNNPQVKLAVGHAYSGIDFIMDDGVYLINNGTSALNSGVRSVGAIELSSDSNTNYSSATGRFEGIKFKTSEEERMRITEIGNVGIGTTTPAEKLEVAGKVKANTFIATQAGSVFPDYVFQKYYTGTSSLKTDYSFKTLSQVEDFVKTNGHLPGYQSAEAIKKQGYIDLMATQLTNVEKIEELYLHSIEQDKVLKAKDARIESLENKNKELEARLQKLEALLVK
ncbi:hypothetical protein [Riemerella anatipestifer]|uniref:Peptidase S74 domain-containing protein n=1 Tax=Riemerella anatipestifer TaxID=34085 RepID=A0A1S7DS14_RIEAN|nr:hypothetical protein [Riemerella anatipestifer]AQY21912.1 hypothetical protein AB406_0962 [Riemerella anatipestifer]MCD5969258.1 hypothetical protein [Riemerella anatipestifer]MCO4304863.1 hypothetical protein [Riemerella anatipestifer]MCO7353759.1 hypothetical protein [Riemerella anatipestifer]MCQ4040250.1 hypothetical protein [Riemerella anatipestifer]